MTRTCTLALVVALAAPVLTGQQAAARGNDRVQLETAITLEVVDGDLAQALAIYRGLITSADRTVRGQALLRLGRLYQRIGHADAVLMLDRALAFTDQPAVAAGARESLGRTGQGRPAAAPRTVLVNSRAANAEFVAVSPNGRLLAYTDYNANANLVIRDTSTGIARQVTTDGVAPGTEVGYKAFSRDGRRIAYTFNLGELRVVDVNLSAAQVPAARMVFKPESGSVTPYDWSADGTRLAIQVFKGREAAQIGVLSIEDGRFQVVRSLDWRGSSRLSLSPDGAYLAYDRPSVENGEHDVYVVATSGAQEIAVSTPRGRDAIVGWSHDGKHLLFVSERTGTTDLWAQPMRGGRTNGAAIRLQATVSATPVGITESGDVYFEVDPSTVGIYVAPFDPATGRIGVPAAQPIAGQRPVWSPDGKQIAHAVARSRAIVGVTTVATGRTREIMLGDLQYVQEFSWSPDGRSLLAKGASNQGRGGLFRIDLGTGDVTTVALTTAEARGPVTWGQPAWWRGTGSIAYLRLRTQFAGRLPGLRTPGLDAPRYIERELGTGAERDLIDFSSEPWATFGIVPSPDRAFVASRSPGQGDAGGRGAYAGDPTSFVVVHDVSTKKARRVFTAPFANAFTGSIEWLPDGSALVVTKRTAVDGARLETWIVPLDASAPRKVEGGVQNLLSGVHLAPNGRLLAMLAGDRRDSEIQVFERIVPGARAR